MKIDNPFESGQIKNYLLFYAGVVVIMILFFIAATLFHDVKQEKRKSFDINITKIKEKKSEPFEKGEQKPNKPVIKLMQKDIY